MSGATPYNDKDGRHSIALIKEKKVSSHHQPQEAILLTPHDVVPQKPSARNTPMISFQPHYTEISTDQPSVSGRLYLHIPKIPGKKFRFVSMTLQLRLKEAMSWTRQDLVSFEIEKQSWSQTVWERKINLPYQDRQVEESDEPYVAVVKEPSSKSQRGRIEIAADEWRWEWLMPVTEKEVRPESFEGSMGNVWYELEAKCLFRWDEVDKDGNVKPSTKCTYETSSESLTGHGLERGPAASLLKAVEVSSAKSKSLAQVFSKLRVGGKSKKIQATGDFSPADQHDQYIKESLRARKNSMPQGGSGVNGGHAGALGTHREGLLSASSRAHSSPHLSSLGLSNSNPHHAHAAPEYPPFLIRKVLKLYFIKPPPNTSSSPAFFLPPPSMALPTLPGTRRLKAIIPGARIQVQIQIPSLIPIRGYAQTSQLVPDKKGGLVLSKHASQNQQHDHQHHNYQRHNNSHHALELDSGYLDNFQAALTVRKVTQKEINNNNNLKKRYHSASAGINSTSVFATAGDALSNAGASSVRKRMHSSNSFSNADLHGQYAVGAAVDTGAGTVPAERPWRREILVRKVKCEFWQKESCRLPSSSSDSPSRSMKYAMGPAFTYSEKEQVQERQRERSHSLSQQTNSQLPSAPRSPTQQTTAVSWDTSVTGGSSNPGINDRKNSNSATPVSPVLNTACVPSQSNLSAPSSPLQAPTMTHSFERKGSNASQYSSVISSQPRTSFSSSHASRPHMMQGHHSSQGSKPFMLLIPVPLNSPKLRQTFAWPSVETPAPTNNKGYEPAPLPMPRNIPDVSLATHNMTMANPNAGLVTGIGTTTSPDVSDTPRSSESGLVVEDVVAGGRRNHHYGHSRSHQHQTPAAKAIATRSRIEVKHYLSFRLSIDMLEYEGELDQDEELDLEALEEQQLQQIRNGQELSAYRPNVTINNSKVLSRAGGTLSMMPTYGLSSSTTSSVSSLLSPPPTSNNQGHELSRQGSGTLSRAPMKDATAAVASSSVSSIISSHPSSVLTTTAPTTVTSGTMTIQPALTFLNPTAGLLDMEPEVDNGHKNSVPASSSAVDLLTFLQPPFANYDPQQRRGSTASEGTVKSTSTTDSSHHHRHATSLVAGAIGALKKKVSTSALNSIVNVVTPAMLTPVPALPQSLSGSNTIASPMSSQQHHPQNHPHQRTHRTAPTVHKLKDFVIRVPITVVIQVEDLARVGTARIDGADSVTQTTGASATVTESMDGSHESETGTILTADQRDNDRDQPTSSGSNNKGLTRSSFAVEGQPEPQPPYLALLEHQRLVEGKGGKGRKMSIGDSLEIRSIHGQIEGVDVDDEDGDAEYVEGQFIADPEQD